MFCWRCGYAFVSSVVFDCVVVVVVVAGCGCMFVVFVCFLYTYICIVFVCCQGLETKAK